MNVQVSVIIPAFNEEKYIKKAIFSILGQRFRGIEIIVIDDCSSDNTSDVVQFINSNQLKLIRNDKNLGVVASMNKAIAVSSGEFIARMDADDMSLPERLAKQVALMERNLNCVAVGCGHYLLDYQRKEFRRIVPVTDDKTIRKEMLSHNPINTGTALYRKSALEKVGGFDESDTRGEGFSILLKLAMVGELGNVPDAEYVYFVRQNGENRCLDGGFQYRNKAMQEMTARAGGLSPGMLASFKSKLASQMWSIYKSLPRPIQVAIRNLVSQEKHYSLSESERLSIESMYENL